MPFLDTPGLAPETPASDAPLPVEPSVPAWSTTFGAAFRTGNTIGSALSAETLGVDGSRAEPGYNPWDDIKGTKYEPYWNSFQNSANSRYSATLKQQIDREDDDRRTLAASGWRGTLTGLAAGVLDPVLFVPVGGELADAGKGAWAIGKGALAGARTAGAATALQEAALHASQQTRTGAESVENVGANVVLGSLLGGAFGLLSRGEAKAADQALGRIHRGDGVPTVEDMSVPATGADVTRHFTNDELAVKGDKVSAIANATKAISPNMRSNFRAVPEVRQVAQQLAENTLYQVMHDAGDSVGPAVETSMRVAIDRRLSQATEAHNQAFADMKKAGVNMSRQDFEERVGAAARTNDIDAGGNDYVSKAAQAWREKLVTPFKDDAIAHGLLPPDVDPATADSYFHRVWNRDKLIAQEGQFKDVVTSHYDDVLSADYGAEQARLARRVAKVDQQVSDLRSTPEDRVALMQQLRDAGDKLDRDNPDAVNHYNDVLELRRQAKEAKDAGNTQGARELAQQAKELHRQGGPAMGDYLQQRSDIRSRMNSVDKGEAGIANRRDAVLQTLADIEDTNRKTLSRLVAKGQRFQKEMQRLDPQKFADRLADLKDSFAKAAEQADKTQEKIAALREKMQGEAGPAAPPTKEFPPLTQREPMSFDGQFKGHGLGRDTRNPSHNPTKAKIPEWFGDVDKTLGDLSEKLGLPVRPKLWVGTGSERSRVNGLSYSNGHIVLNDKISRQEALHFGIHEFGHQVESQLYKGADQATKDAIDAAWREHRLGDGSPENFAQTRPITNSGGGLNSRADAYSKSFPEWFAEQTSRWITQNKAPTGVVDKFFKGVADIWRKLYEKVVGHVPLSKEVDAFMRKNWRGDLLDEVKPKTAGEIDAGRAHDLLAQHTDALDRYAERMNSLSARIEKAEQFDHEATLAEVKQGVDELIDQANRLSLARGERSQRLKERLASLDTKKIDAQVEQLHAQRAQTIRDFYDKWEIERGGQGVDHTSAAKPDFTAAAREIANQVHDHLTGNSGGGAAHPDYFVPITRGPLKDRTFKIPDAKIEPWLENNVIHVNRRYARTMAGEVEMTRRFGRADMRDQFEQIKNSYADLRDKVTKAPTAEEAKALIGQRPGVADSLAAWSRGQGHDEVSKEHVLQWLRHDENGARTDLEGLRDLIRGTYKQSENSGNWARISRSVMAFNYVRMMGNFLAANIAQVYRPAMVHGLSAYMRDGIAPLMRNLGAIVRGGEHGLTGMIEEAKLAGIGVERILHNRMATMAEMGDPYARQTALERTLENATHVASRWNGMSAFFDLGRTLSSVMTQHRIIDGALNDKDTPYLGWLGLNKNAGMTGRIAEQFKQFGDTIDGLHTANTERWTDPEAVRVFRAALSKEASATLHAKSVGDTPLWSHTPTGRLFFQFRTFNLAAHQRTMLRGLQESPARFTGGLVAMTSFGMLGAYLTALRAGHDRFKQFEEDVANNPLHLLAEGIDKSGMFTLPFEVANRVEDFTKGMGRVTGNSRFSFNPIKTPIEALGRAATGGSVPDIHGDATDPLSALVGPSGALPGQLALAAGGLGAQIAGKGASKKQAKAQAALLPFQSYGGMKEILQAIQGNSTLTPHP